MMIRVKRLHYQNTNSLMNMTIKKSRACTKMRVRLKVIDIFSFSFLLFFLFLKKSQTSCQIWARKQKAIPPYIYIKKLLVRQVLTLHQSFQAEVVQNQKKKIYISYLKKGLETYLVFTTSTTFSTIN